MEKTLGARIAELRKEKGYKQDEIAEKLGVSPQAVSKWENDITCPDIMTLPALAGMLDTTVDFLLSGEKKEQLPETVFVKEEKRKDVSELILKIMVDNDGDHVRVNLPVALLKAINFNSDSAEKMGVKMGGVDIDWDQIMMLVESGVMGKLVEIEGKNGEYVSISVE